MISVLWLAAIVLTTLYIYNYWKGYTRNLAAAKRSGIPYIVSPIYTYNRAWLVTHKLWIPLLEKLPSSWTASWLPFLDPEWLWGKKFKPFEEIGSDFFMMCTPGQNALFVANAEANAQIVTRRNDFPKPIELYAATDLYGKNVVSTEGQVWRHHRKIASPPFAEANMGQVWEESLTQGTSMLDSWVGKERTQEVSKSVSDVSDAAMRLSLYVISKAGFGRGLKWPHEEIEEKGEVGALSEGHTMTYKDSLSHLLENILPVMLLPRWFLSHAPFKVLKDSHESWVEWGRYMKEMFETKKAEIQAGKDREGMDFMGAFINGAGYTATSNKAADKNDRGSKQLLTDDEIIGNAFVFILAGHETTANSIHFSLLLLAMNWSSQARLQSDLDEIFGDRPVSEWDYERDAHKLFGSMVGAVMAEELRLIPPVLGIPKSTSSGSPQPLTINGKHYTVPEHCYVTLNTAAVHRNPKHWPTMCGPNASAAEIEKDLDSFKPERWLLDPSKSDNRATTTHEQLAAEAETDGQGTSSALFRPTRGSYIPFSDGARSCIGRRFAQIEVLAVLAVIFRDYSVELALDEFATEEEVAAMSEDQRRETWLKAKHRAEYLLKYGMGSIITIQMRGGNVPMRFVKRGGERFKYD